MLGLLRDERILVHPGYFFDFEHEAFLVFSLLVPETSLPTPSTAPALRGGGMTVGRDLQSVVAEPGGHAAPRPGCSCRSSPCAPTATGASARSATSPPAARWLESAGLSLLQLLPINELPPHETSPYSSLSAMAVDPQYI